jgi:hypothetical protein
MPVILHHKNGSRRIVFSYSFLWLHAYPRKTDRISRCRKCSSPSAQLRRGEEPLAELQKEQEKKITFDILQLLLQEVKEYLNLSFDRSSESGCRVILTICEILKHLVHQSINFRVFFCLGDLEAGTPTRSSIGKRYWTIPEESIRKAFGNRKAFDR